MGGVRGKVLDRIFVQDEGHDKKKRMEITWAWIN